MVLEQLKEIENKTRTHKNNLENVTMSGKENLKRMRSEIEKNIATYHVRKGDTIASISNRSGVGMDELIDLNIFLDKPLERR